MSYDHQQSKARARRNAHHFERKWLVWNHSNWSKVDTLFRRRERHAAKAALRKEAG